MLHRAQESGDCAPGLAGEPLEDAPMRPSSRCAFHQISTPPSSSGGGTPRALAPPPLRRHPQAAARFAKGRGSRVPRACDGSPRRRR
eukprot:364238-Chlamydomonas_euryale.AAC.9